MKVKKINDVVSYEFIIVNLYGGEDRECGYDEWKFSKITELDEKQIFNLGDLCGVTECSEISDDEWNEWIKNGGNDGLVKNVLIDMDENGILFKGKSKNYNEYKDFVSLYGEMNGIRWGVEFDDNCSVVLKGNLNKLREMLKEKIKE